MFAPLRIALVGPLPPPSGGMANQTLQLAGLLAADGHRVHTIQTNAPYRPDWVASVPLLRAMARLLPYLTLLWRTAGQVQLFHVMANSGWSWHLFAAPVIWIARLRGCAVVINYRGGEADNFMRRSHTWVRPSMRRAHAVIVPSGFLQVVFGRYGVATQVVPNIVNLERFSGAPATVATVATAVTITPALRLLVARNLESIYDNATALRAFAIVRTQRPEARLTIAGSGPLRSELEQLAVQLGVADAVTFTGRVENAGMAALYQDADIMLNPSLIDNTPNSVLEALASGVAVVSTNVGGVPYLVEDGRTALLVPPGAPEAMAAAVLRLAAEPALAADLRQAGRHLVQQFAWTSVRPCLLQIYHAILDSPPIKEARPS